MMKEILHQYNLKRIKKYERKRSSELINGCIFDGNNLFFEPRTYFACELIYCSKFILFV